MEEKETETWAAIQQAMNRPTVIRDEPQKDTKLLRFAQKGELSCPFNRIMHMCSMQCTLQGNPQWCFMAHLNEKSGTTIAVWCLSPKGLKQLKAVCTVCERNPSLLKKKRRSRVDPVRNSRPRPGGGKEPARKPLFTVPDPKAVLRDVYEWGCADCMGSLVDPSLYTTEQLAALWSALLVMCCELVPPASDEMVAKCQWVVGHNYAGKDEAAWPWT